MHLTAFRNCLLQRDLDIFKVETHIVCLLVKPVRDVFSSAGDDRLQQYTPCEIEKWQLDQIIIGLDLRYMIIEAFKPKQGSKFVKADAQSCHRLPFGQVLTLWHGYWFYRAPSRTILQLHRSTSNLNSVSNSINVELRIWFCHFLLKSQEVSSFNASVIIYD